jgi:hypothetical protein
MVWEGLKEKIKRNQSAQAADFALHSKITA